MDIRIKGHPEVNNWEWHRWWAWYPVGTIRDVNGGYHWVWFEWVERKMAGNWDPGFIYRCIC